MDWMQRPRHYGTPPKIRLLGPRPMMSKKSRYLTGLVKHRKFSGRRSGHFEPPAAGGDLISEQAQEAIMSHWHDTMVDRPETDGTVYVTGWTISGLAVLVAIVAVWVLGI
jgi:hypothetical protein